MHEESNSEIYLLQFTSSGSNYELFYDELGFVKKMKNKM